MWQKEKNTNPIVRLALLLTLITTPIITGLLKSDYVLAQSQSETPSFPLPTKVDDGTKIRIDGSASMTRANEALKQRFEKEYSGAEVELATNGTDDALKALQEDKIDIAAIGRDLTPEEEKQGLAQQRLRREKIAIIVGENNSFKGDLSNQMFTKIYRGEVTDWSQIGGRAGKIRVIDLPDLSDTRQAFRNYPLFSGNLNTGSTAIKLENDDPAEVVKQLGNDGIGFVLANQVSKLDNVRVLSMHKVLPTDSRYPYSQSLVYVFKQNPSQAVKDFVGFATAVPGKEALEKAREEEAQAVATSVTQAVSGDGNATAEATATPGSTAEANAEATATPGNTAEATVTPGSTAEANATPGSTAEANAEATATPGSTAEANADGATTTAGNETVENASETGTIGTATNTSDSSSNSGDEKVSYRDSAGVAAEAANTTIPWWWILLPIAVLGALVFWWLLGRRKYQEDDTVARGVLPDDAPPPFTPTSTSSSGTVSEPLSAQPLEPASTLIQTPAETAVNENTGNQGINAAGIAAGVAGLGLGAAALSSRDKEDTSDNRENLVDETSSELQLDAPDLQQPDVSLNLDAPNLDAPNLEEPDIPDTSLDLEAPAAVVNNSYPSISLIPNSTAEVPPTEPVDITSAADESQATELVDTTSAEDESQATELVDTNSAADESQATKLVDKTSAEEETSSPSTTNWLGNFALGSAAAAGAAKIKSQLANKDASQSRIEDNSTTTDDTASQATPYPQLPDVWETSDTETTPTTNLELSNQGNEENQTPEIKPSDLWGTPQTEQPATDVNTEEQENSSFSLGGIAAAGAAGLAGAAALGSKLFDRENNQTSEESNNTEEEREPEAQQQITTPSDLWENPPTQQPISDEIVAEDDAGEQQIQVTEETPSAQNSDLPEVRITTPNEQIADAPKTSPQEPLSSNGLPNVWVTPANSQSTTPEETVSEEKDNLASAGAVIAGGAAVGAAALGSQLFGMRQQSDSEDIALDKIADEAEADAAEIQDNATSEVADAVRADVGEIQDNAAIQVADAVEIQDNAASQVADAAQADLGEIQDNAASEVAKESNILLANRTPKWAYASWNITAADRQAMHEQGANQLVLRLYDVTDVDLSYQQARLVQQYECEETVSHRYVAIPNTEKDYVAEIGYLTGNKEWLLLSRSPIVRVFSRPHKDFWFEADAELIIHGATEPGSKVSIEGHSIKVKQDGTFHLRVPFTEALIDYLITAVAPNSEEAKTIHMQFSQTEREDS